MTDYQFIRKQIRTGDLIEWTGQTPLAWAIRARTGQEVNHTSMALEYHLNGDGERRVCLCEALGDGVQLHFLSTRLEGYKGAAWWVRMNCEDEATRVRLAQAMLEFRGRPYGWLDLVKCAFRPVQLEEKNLICSEAVQAAAIRVGLINKNFNEGRVLVPGQLHRTGWWSPLKVRVG